MCLLRIARIECATAIFNSQGFRPLCFVARFLGRQQVSLQIEIATDLVQIDRSDLIWPEAPQHNTPNSPNKNAGKGDNIPNVDGPAIRNANRGDSCETIRANRPAQKKRKTIFMTFEQFA